MADTLDIGTPRDLLVQGRNPFADETITEDSAGSIISIAAADSTGAVVVTGVANGTATITVQPGSEDSGFSSGTDTITVATIVPQTPLTVSLA